MKKRNYFKGTLLPIVAAAMAISMLATGCGSKSADNTAGSGGTEASAQKESATATPAPTQTGQTSAEEESDQTPAAQQSSQPAAQEALLLFYGDQNAEFIISKTVMVENKEDAQILSQLTHAGVLKGTESLNQVSEKDGVLNLDFNQAFSDTVSNSGTAGERIIIGSVVNTFLAAYPDAASVMITVDGKTLETGHAIYDQPQSQYLAGADATIPVTVTIDGKDQDVDLSRIYSELGCAINYDDSRFFYKQSDDKMASICLKDSKDSMDLFLNCDKVAKEELLSELKKDFGDDLKVTETKLGTDALAATKLEGTMKNTEHEAVYYILEGNGKTWTLQLDYSDGGKNLLPIMEETIQSFTLVS